MYSTSQHLDVLLKALTDTMNSAELRVFVETGPDGAEIWQAHLERQGISRQEMALEYLCQLRARGALGEDFIARFGAHRPALVAQLQRDLLALPDSQHLNSTVSRRELLVLRERARALRHKWNETALMSKALFAYRFFELFEEMSEVRSALDRLLVALPDSAAPLDRANRILALFLRAVLGSMLAQVAVHDDAVRASEALAGLQHSNELLSLLEPSDELLSRDDAIANIRLPHLVYRAQAYAVLALFNNDPDALGSMERVLEEVRQSPAYHHQNPTSVMPIFINARKAHTQQEDQTC